MKIVSKHEIAELFRASHIHTFWMLDEEYVLTTLDYLCHDGIQAYHRHLAKIIGCSIRDVYRLYTFDCVDFAIGYRQFCVMMHRRYHRNITAGLAIGFGVHRELHHALNVAIIMQGGQLCVRILEPQPTGQLADVSGAVLYSGFSVVVF